MDAGREASTMVEADTGREASLASKCDKQESQGGRKFHDSLRNVD